MNYCQKYITYCIMTLDEAVHIILLYNKFEIQNDSDNH